jgi:hypothetical protein
LSIIQRVKVCTPPSARHELLFAPTISGDGHILTEVNILNGVQNFDAFRQGPLECLAAGNQSHAAGPFYSFIVFILNFFGFLFNFFYRQRLINLFIDTAYGIIV